MNDRLEKIKAYKTSKDRKELESMLTEVKEYHKLMGKIADLQPRIHKLIETANTCLENDIELNMCRKKDHWMFDEYKMGTFVSNSITHKVGFIQGNGISYGYNPKTKIKMVGIVNGGAFGKLDFYTNGIDTFSVHEDTKECTKARNKDMIKFLKGFDKFEKEFYEYIDNLIG